MPTDKPKRKQPSGAANRKKKAERDRQQRMSSGDFMMSSPQSTSMYGAAIQWDPNAIATQLPVYGVPPPVFVNTVAGYLAQLEQGAFYLCATLLDGMLRDDRVHAFMQVRLDGLVSATVDLLPGEDSEQGLNVKEDCEKLLSRMVPIHQLKELLRWGLFLSVGIAQVLDSRTADETIPTFKVWHPRYLRFDWLLRKYRLVTENQGEITLDFANGENYLDGAVSLRENGDEEHWIVYEPYGTYGWLHGALLRPLILPWITRYWTRTWWSRHQEIHGQPIRLGIIPADRTPATERQFLSQLSNIGSESVIRLVQGEEGNKFDVKLLESTAMGWEGFKQLLEHCDDSIAMVILGQTQSSKGQGGLGSQENAGESTLLKLHRMDSLVGTTIRDQMLKAWAADNYGNEELAPELKWDIEPAEDTAKKALELLNVAKAIQTLTLAPGAASHIDIRSLLEEFNIPLIASSEGPFDVPGEPNSLLQNDIEGATLKQEAAQENQPQEEDGASVDQDQNQKK